MIAFAGLFYEVNTFSQRSCDSGYIADKHSIFQKQLLPPTVSYIMRSNVYSNDEGHSSVIQHIARVFLGLFLLTTGIGHLSWWRSDFQAQVPNWLPGSPDLAVILSGIVEIGLALLLLFSKKRKQIGWITAVFFILVFPGNIAQFNSGTNAFGLNTDFARAVRLVFQPLLIFWAVWSTGAWNPWKH